MKTPRTALGFDLGGTQIKAVLVDPEGTILRRESRPTGGELATGRPWAQTIRLLAAEIGADSAVGLSAPGLAAVDRRSIAILPGRLPGLEGFDWTKALERESLVPVQNDAQSALFGEAWLGAARGLSDAILLSLGTGVGGAILSEGRILRGRIGRAGHFGHICLDVEGLPSITGMPGALEGAIGNYNIRERSRGRFDSTHELLAAVGAHDAEACAIWARSIRALACAIASLVNVLDPEAVILGGGIAAAGELLFAPLRDQLASIEWRPTGAGVSVVPAELGEWAGAIGAARMALLES